MTAWEFKSIADNKVKSTPSKNHRKFVEKSSKSVLGMSEVKQEHNRCVADCTTGPRVLLKKYVHSICSRKLFNCLSRPLLRLLYGDIGFVYPACL